MPRRFTMSTLVTRCQQRADKESDEHISTSEWKSLISEQYGELYSTVAETGMRYFERVETITATGADDYAEPSNHLATVAVRFVDASGRRRELEEIMVQETPLWLGMTGEALAYALIDDRLVLYPKPTSGTYELVYVPQPPDISGYDDANVIDVVTSDGEAFLLWGVAVKALAKSRHDVTLAMHERDAAKERLQEWAVLRALNAPRRRPIMSSGDMLLEGGWWQR